MHCSTEASLSLMVVAALLLCLPSHARLLHQARTLRLQPLGTAPLSPSPSLMIDLHTRREGITGLCPQYVWLYVGPRPDPTQPPSFNDNQFILDPCDSTDTPSQSDSPQHSKKPGAAALPKPGVVVTFPPNAQSAGQYQHEAAAAASSRTTSTTTIRVDVYDVAQLQGFRQAASGIQCTWAEEEGGLVAPGSAGGTSAAYECDSCGKIIINKSCSGSDQSCALATFECAFGAKDTSCSGSSCAYGHK